MIFSQNLIFSDGQAITATAASTNVIDIKTTGTAFGASSPLARDLGKSNHKIPLSIHVTEAFNNLTSITVAIQTDDNSAFSSPKTVEVSQPILLAALAVGAKISLPDYFPEGTDEQFIRLYYTVAGTAPTTGKLSAGVVMARQTN